MRYLKRSALIVTIGLLFAGGGFLGACKRSQPAGQTAESAGAEQEAVARVRVATIGKGVISKGLTVYGNIVPKPGAEVSISVTFESRVNAVFASAGQEVGEGDPLLELGPSPDMQLKLQQTDIAYKGAKATLEQVQRRFQLKLATNEQVQQARQAFEDACASVESLKERGATGCRQIRADAPGVVASVPAQRGAIVQPGAPLVQFVRRNDVEARLGVEPSDMGKLRPEMPVTFSVVPIAAGSPVVGHIRAFSRSVNPATRLVDVFVSVPVTRTFLLGQYVSGTVAVSSTAGLIVPRSAVLPDGEKLVLFIVENGRARRKTVQGLAEADERMVVAGEGLRQGQRVIILGNYELQDNMRVTLEEGR